MTEEAAATTQETPKKPSWGRVIGMFFACWALGVFGCELICWIMITAVTPSGFIPIIAAIIIAVLYRKGAFTKESARLDATMKLLCASIIVGIILGIVICFVTAAYAAPYLRDAAAGYAQLANQTTGLTSTVYHIDSNWLNSFANEEYFGALLQFFLPSIITFGIGAAVVYGIGKVVQIASKD